MILVVSGTGRLWFQRIDRQLGRSETRKLGSVVSRPVGRLRRGTVGQRDSETVNIGNSGTVVPQRQPHMTVLLVADHCQENFRRDEPNT